MKLQLECRAFSHVRFNQDFGGRRCFCGLAEQKLCVCVFVPSESCPIYLCVTACRLSACFFERPCLSVLFAESLVLVLTFLLPVRYAPVRLVFVLSASSILVFPRLLSIMMLALCKRHTLLRALIWLHLGPVRAANSTPSKQACSLS